MKHFRSNVSKPRLPINETAQGNSITTPTAPLDSIINSSLNQPAQERHNSQRSHRRSASIGRQPTSQDLPPPYAEIQPPINPYYNTNGTAFTNNQIEQNTIQQNSSFNGNITNDGSTTNYNVSNSFNDSQTSNVHGLNHNVSSNNCSAANLSTLSHSSSFIQSSPIRIDNNANTSHGHSSVQPRSLYPNLNASQSSNNVSQNDHSSSLPSPEHYQQHLNELRYSVNRLSLGNDQF